MKSIAKKHFDRVKADKENLPDLLKEAQLESAPQTIPNEVYVRKMVEIHMKAIKALRLALGLWTRLLKGEDVKEFLDDPAKMGMEEWKKLLEKADSLVDSICLLTRTI